MRILVIDDHEDVRTLLARTLTKDGHQIVTAGNLAEARAELAEREAELVVLDLGLPDGEGLALCRELRQAGRGVPVLVLTAQTQVQQRVEGFEAGADDYLGKPFAIAELRARVRALGRRGTLTGGTWFRLRKVELDLSGRHAFNTGQEVPLTAREWSVLDLLIRREGRLVPREEILDIVWGDVSSASNASLDVIVGRIRRKLGDDVVRTLRGEGYSIGS